MGDKITLVVAASAEAGKCSEWGAVLIRLTKALVEIGLADEPSNGLGGYWSYATNYENNTFLLHRYCWCEDEDCPYCGGCQCEDDAFWYEVDGQLVSRKEWDTFFEQNTPDRKITTFDEWSAAATAANARRRSGQIEAKKCGYCQGTKFAQYGQVKDWGVPLFWHKPSGIRMNWYKYIGRGQSLYIPNGCTMTADELLADCLNSLR